MFKKARQQQTTDRQSRRNSIDAIDDRIPQTMTDRVDDDDGMATTLKTHFSRCWNFHRKFGQRYRRRFNVQSSDSSVDAKITVSNFNHAFEDLTHPYHDVVDAKLETQNWRYHLTNQHF